MNFDNYSEVYTSSNHQRAMSVVTLLHKAGFKAMLFLDVGNSTESSVLVHKDVFFAAKKVLENNIIKDEAAE